MALAEVTNVEVMPVGSPSAVPVCGDCDGTLLHRVADRSMGVAVGTLVPCACTGEAVSWDLVEPGVEDGELVELAPDELYGRGVFLGPVGLCPAWGDEERPHVLPTTLSAADTVLGQSVLFESCGHCYRALVGFGRSPQTPFFQRVWFELVDPSDYESVRFEAPESRAVEGITSGVPVWEVLRG